MLSTEGWLLQADSPDTAESDEQDADRPEAAAKRIRNAQPISQAQKPCIEIPALGCSKCRRSTTGCKKCRSERAEAFQVRLAVHRQTCCIAAEVFLLSVLQEYVEPSCWLGSCP